MRMFVKICASLWLITKLNDGLKNPWFYNGKIWTLKHGKPNTHSTCFGSCQCGYTHVQQMVIEGLDHSMANVNAQLRTQYVWFKKSICPLRVSLQLGCTQYCKYTIPKTFMTTCHNLEIACSMMKPIDQQLENTKIQHSTWLLEILLVSNGVKVLILSTMLHVGGSWSWNTKCKS